MMGVFHGQNEMATYGFDHHHLSRLSRDPGFSMNYSPVTNISGYMSRCSRSAVK
jgi:hypothetical protein